MPCTADELRQIPLFSLLDEDELNVLATQVEVREFAAKQRIYKAGEPSQRAYVVLSGAVEVTLLDEDGQEVIFSSPRHGEPFGFASMLEATPHQTTAVASEASTCLEVDRHDLSTLLERKPLAGLDMLTVLAREIHIAQGVIRGRAMRSANELIDEAETFGERIADKVASFGGSWTFIITFGVTMLSYVTLSIVLVAFHGSSWDPYPFILLNLFLSMLAAIQAPVIMMSQNRQDQKDRLRSELDFEVNRRAEAEIQALSRKIHFLGDKLADIDEHLRPARIQSPDEPLS
jgi:CRP/FNR family transcriptional regulator, cyclic AMP receptor protein